MNGGNAARWDRNFTARGMRRPAAINPRCRSPAICRSTIRVFVFMVILLYGADGPQHRQYDVADKGWVKKPADSPAGDNRGKQPTAKSPPQAKFSRLAVY